MRSKNDVEPLQVSVNWSDPETYVCAECVEDQHIQKLIVQRAVNHSCDYCGKSGISGRVSTSRLVLEIIVSTLVFFFTDPEQAEEEIPEEAILPRFDTVYVLSEIGFRSHGLFFVHVVDAFGDEATWVRAAHGRWNLIQDGQRLRVSWSRFQQLVKHQTRYHFANSRTRSRREESPIHVLAELGEVVRRLGCISTVAKDTRIHRVRLAGGWEPSASQLGAPPSRIAGAGRMNPAGVSYFYAAFDERTAIAEVVTPPPVEVVVAEFKLKKALSVVDLSSVPLRPSIFDVDKRLEYQYVDFFNAFVEAISTPVRKDGHEHVDYVPSQVVSEWFAQVFAPMTGGRRRVNGIVFPSAVQPGGKNIVVFPMVRQSASAFASIEYVRHRSENLSNWRQVMRAISPIPAPIESADGPPS
jgi:RES domain-containing protein